MKIIFLDIDGVLNSMKSMMDQRDNHNNIKHDDIPAKEHIVWLNHIIEKTGAKVVLSSSWRKFISAIMMDMLLYSLGFKGDVISATGTTGNRADEIQQWIDGFNSRGVDNIESYVVLDDDFVDIDNLVSCDAEIGLGEAEVNQAIDILGRIE